MIWPTSGRAVTNIIHIQDPTDPIRVRLMGQLFEPFVQGNEPGALASATDDARDRLSQCAANGAAIVSAHARSAAVSSPFARRIRQPASTSR